MEKLISIREDGTCVRTPLPRFDASPLQFQDGVACKDVFINNHHAEGEGTDGQGLMWARIYLPQTPATLSIDLHNLNGSPRKVCPSLPLIVYFHGGGFVICSVADSLFHSFTHRIAQTVHAIVIAVEYRLAPEHRLPAAYDDCLAALTWLQSQASTIDAENIDPWLHTCADFSQCYLMGDSAGGNIVYNLSLKLANMKMDPLQIKGHVLLHPFFGGVTNTETEEAMANDTVLSLRDAHWVWEQALPKGADRDHPSSNPMSIPASVYANARLPKTLVAIAHGDPMKERQMQYFKTLKEAGVDVHLKLQDGKHGCYIMEGSEKTTSFITDVIASFLHDC